MPDIRKRYLSLMRYIVPTDKQFSAARETGMALAKRLFTLSGSVQSPPIDAVADDEVEDTDFAPKVDESSGAFAFQQDVNMPQGGFQFGGFGAQ